MPPKKKAPEPSKKAEQKKKERIIEVNIDIKYEINLINCVQG